jgi:hypothetical protein
VGPWGIARGRLNSGGVYPVAHFSPHDSCVWEEEAFRGPLDPREVGWFQPNAWGLFR